MEGGKEGKGGDWKGERGGKGRKGEGKGKMVGDCPPPPSDPKYATVHNQQPISPKFTTSAKLVKFTE